MKKPGTLSNDTKLVLKAIDGGIPVKEAITLVTGNADPHYNTILSYRNKYKKYQLSNDKADKIAYTGILTYAKGKAINGIEPSDRTVLKACEIIKDRTEPAVKYSAHVEHSYIDIDISDCKDSDKSYELHATDKS